MSIIFAKGSKSRQRKNEGVSKDRRNFSFKLKR